MSYPSFINAATQLKDAIGDYDPEFMSYEAITKTYIINMDNSEQINVTVSGDDPSYRIYLSLVGPIDSAGGLQDLSSEDNWKGTYTVPSVNGTAVFATGLMIGYPVGNELRKVTFDSPPWNGTWIARVFTLSQGRFDYTITSSHPIQPKPVIHIPWRCTDCHNPGATGDLAGAKTLKPIPSWDNQGLSYTHTDINKDGKDDVTCRLCHSSFHEISIRNCTDCHKQRPGGHNMENYYTMGYVGCLFCHKDPHFEPEVAAGGNCTDCHLEGGANASGMYRIINKTGFFNDSNIHRNVTGEFSYNYTQLSRVCWGCHFNNYTAQLINPTHINRSSKPPECEDCHFTATPLNNEYLNRKPPLQAIEHQPEGEDIRTNTSLANCTMCHNKSLTIPPPTDNIISRRAENYVSHYGLQRKDMWIIDNNRISTNCSYCHLGGGREFNDVFADVNNANITHGVNCIGCHGSGRIHDESLTSPAMTEDNEACLACHNNMTEKSISASAFGNSEHKKLKCIDCHT
ncbi:MAG: multiheme c-type cytochrome, partial [Candidatus Methanoperedens sp.]|nr:multiheme c-type cytochrome [Candidatus Methanoperedens sp.]